MSLHTRFSTSLPSRPNILILMSDQHRADLMTCAGRDKVPTPNLDRLASNGIRFDNAYCPAPLCLPSRMSFMTGEYPETIGIHGNYDLLDPRQRTLAHHFGEHGYLTGLIGKMHFRDACNHGFAYYLSINDWLAYLGPKARHYADEIASNPLNDKFFHSVRDAGSGLPDVDDLWDSDTNWVGHVTARDRRHPVSELAADETLDMFVARETVRFLHERKDTPFMLVAGFMRPHPPMYPPPGWDRYEPDDVTLPDVGDISQYPACVQQHINRYQSIGDERLRADRAGYYGNLAFLDHCIGHVLAGLEASGQRDNTIVIYCSDHGDMDGDHGLVHKAAMFESSVKIPLIVNWPQHLRAGNVVGALVNLMDLYPTLAELVGLPVPDGIAARSFAPVLHNPSASGFGTTFAQYVPDDGPGHYMVRENNWKYVHHCNDRSELYDLKADPGEMQNLASGSGHRQQVAHLQQLLAQRFQM